MRVQTIFDTILTTGVVKNMALASHRRSKGKKEGIQEEDIT